MSKKSGVSTQATSVKKIYVATDHTAYALKKKLIAHYTKQHITCIDCGPTQKKSDDDYVDYALKLCKRMHTKRNIKHIKQTNFASLGVLICGTGIGMSIAANKCDGVRAARICSKKDVQLAVQHNHANVITFGVCDLSKAIRYIDTFIATQPNMDARHVRRVNKVNAL
ncbi:MAG: RpiB/LacA/LacB family sugar-phosphate isomerase [Candidatus Woesearchaeota archaeon]